MAQTEVAPIRTIFLFHPNGSFADHFFPAAGSRQLPPMTAPLQDVYDNLVFLDGITYPGELTRDISHTEGVFRCLTGRFNGRSDTDDSIEIRMGKEDWLNRDTTGIRIPSVQLGVANLINFSYKCASRDGTTAICPEADPRKAYASLFSVPNADAGSITTKLLSAAKADLTSIRNQIGNIDGQRERLEQHAEALAFLEYKFANSGSGITQSCRWPDISAAPNYDFSDTSELWGSTRMMPLASDLQQDIAVSALSCGITKTIAFYYGSSEGDARVPSSLIGDHDASHSSPELFALSKQWWMSEVKKFIQKLANTPDINGSLLDNTILVTVSDLGDHDKHDHWRIPMFLASGVNNNVGLVTGRSLDWRNSPHAKSQPIKGISDFNGVLLPAEAPPSISHTEVLDTIRRVAGYTSFQMPQSDQGIMEAWTGGSEPR
jgi:hypothetical protein